MSLQARRFVGLWLVVLLAMGINCDNPGIDEGTSTLVLLNAFPAAGAEGASITDAIQMTFNEAIDPHSVTDASFSLVSENGHEVSGILTVEGSKVRFEQDLPLSMSARYHAKLTRKISGSNGALLAADVTWRFSTAKGRMGSAQRIGTVDDHNGVFWINATIDQQARTWAVWLEDVATFNQQTIVPQPQALVVARQGADRSASSWQRSHRYQAPAVGVALAYACLLWDRQHNGYLVWQQRSADDDRIQLARFDAQKETWGASQTVIESKTAALTFPQCVIDARGELRILWLEKTSADQSKNAIRQRVLDVAQGQWREPTLLVGSGENSKILAVVGVQKSDASLATMFFAIESHATIFLRSAILDGQSARDQQLIAELSPSVEELQMSTNRSGAAFFLWRVNENDTHDASTASLWAFGRVSQKDGWLSPTQIVISPKASQMGNSQLSIDAAGSAFVSWRQADGQDWKIYHASYHRASSRWDAPRLFRSIGTSGSHASAVTTEARPMILAVSSQPNNDVIWSSEQQVSTGPWSAPVELSRHSSGSVVFPAANVVSMPTGQLGFFWYERKRKVHNVGGVLLQHFTLDLWSVLYQPTNL